MRWIHHLFLDYLALKRAFPRATLSAIERAVGEQEKRHRGELRVAIEGGLPLQALVAGRSARERAIGHFTRLRVWDTEDNAGVLVYLLLADRRVEIVADRGIHARASGTSRGRRSAARCSRSSRLVASKRACCPVSRRSATCWRGTTPQTSTEIRTNCRTHR